MTDERTTQSDSSSQVQANTVGSIGPGAHAEVHLHVHPPAALALASRPAGARLHLQPNLLFQEQLGKFETLERLLFGRCGKSSGTSFAGSTQAWKKNPTASVM